MTKILKHNAFSLMILILISLLLIKTPEAKQSKTPEATQFKTPEAKQSKTPEATQSKSPESKQSKTPEKNEKPLTAWSYFLSPLNLYISDSNSSSILSQQLSTDNATMIGILFTNKACLECHSDEQQLQGMIASIWMKYKVEIYRCEIIGNTYLQDLFQIKRFPLVHFLLYSDHTDQAGPQTTQQAGPSTTQQARPYTIYKYYQIVTKSTISFIVHKLLHLQHSNSNHLHESKMVQNQIKMNLHQNELNNGEETDMIYMNKELLSEAIIQKVQQTRIKLQQTTIKSALSQEFSILPTISIVPSSQYLSTIKQILSQPTTILSQDQINNPLLSFEQCIAFRQHHNTITCLLFTFDTNSLADTNRNVHYFITKILFSNHVCEFHQKIYHFYHQFHQATLQNLQSNHQKYIMFTAVLDSIHSRKQAIGFKKMLENILQYELSLNKEQIVIFWMEGQVNPAKIQQLGFKRDAKIPLFAVLDMTNQQSKKILTKNDGVTPIFQKKAIIQFIKEVIDQKKQTKQYITNKQLLKNTLISLALSKQIQLIENQQELHGPNRNNYFLLILSNKQISLNHDNWLQSLLKEYNYLIQRVERFTNTKIQLKIYVKLSESSINLSENQLYLYKIHQQKDNKSDLSKKYQNRVNLNKFCKIGKFCSCQSQFERILVCLNEENIEIPSEYWVNEDEMQQFLMQNEFTIEGAVEDLYIEM